MAKFDHCSCCGTAYADKAWPRTCAACKNTIWPPNPIPVAVAVVPVGFHGDKVLAVRRAIAPKIGELALPGGYMSRGENGMMTACRELQEESGIQLDHREFRYFAEFEDEALNLLLLFYTTNPISLDDFPMFVPNKEASERVVVTRGTTLCFPTHTRVLEMFLSRK